MNLSDVRKSYYEFSGIASTVSRQLGYAGIALIWIFKTGDPPSFHVPQELVFAGFFVVTSLLFDFFQYLYASLAWGAFGRLKERNGESNKTFSAPALINYPTLLFFWTKFALIVTGYVLIAKFILSKSGVEI